MFFNFVTVLLLQHCSIMLKDPVCDKILTLTLLHYCSWESNNIERRIIFIRKYDFINKEIINLLFIRSGEHLNCNSESSMS